MPKMTLPIPIGDELHDAAAAPAAECRVLHMPEA